MPHAELKYSADLEIDAEKVLQLIEERINVHDPAAGECKGRAYPSNVYHHTHILVELSLLTKPHRDAAFSEALREDIERAIKECLCQRCYFSLAIKYSDALYMTNVFDPKSAEV
ncbi:hypothetical protein [Shimia abyssi]|uniref:5-carboxymethyl-2-hydroxymuconate isomerase n=1 Tax=Shimia abyssi TaxID=1662395 RepID=A0A2P8FI06_9RHOB|nr:hypothetical protein [Shimia abyssi]PSL21353.1 hypothetical protein CLV88_102473 [Shimia abyssi]